MDRKFGFPVVTAQNLCATLRELGLKKWAHLEQTVPLDQYLKRDLTEEQVDELRFAPQNEVVFLEDQKGKPWRGFRKRGRPWSTTIAFIPTDDYGDLVPIVGEYKHGADAIMVQLPSGVPNKGDREHPRPMKSCAQREWTEETGIQLASIIPLSVQPIAPSGRQDTDLYYPFLGAVQLPIVTVATRLDAHEVLKTVLMPLSEWLEVPFVLEFGFILESSALSTTHLALAHLGKIKL